jgi:hypothetical protein
MGCESVECYYPSTPLQGEFSCDGLVNCKTDEICLVLDEPTDGCSGRFCEPPPTACVGNLTCACIEDSGAYEINNCKLSDGGMTVEAWWINSSIDGSGGGL